MTLEAFVQKALAASPAVRASEESAAAAAFSRRSLASPASPNLELAPGTGFTNGNLALSQELDLFGRRASLAGVSTAEYKLEQARHIGTRLQIAGLALRALAEYVSANEAHTNAKEAVESAQALLEVARRRFEIGEVPQVHVSRAELELLRLQQSAVQSEAALRSKRTEVATWLGLTDGSDSALPVWSIAGLFSPDAAASSPELLVAAADIEVANASLRAVRAETRPHVQAGLALDSWSMDRNPSLNSSNVGFQVFLSAPIFDLGSNRNARRAAEAQRLASQQRLAEAQRLAELGLKLAREAHQSAQSVAQVYEGDILPKGEAMLLAMRQGYAAGLVSLVEVLEAQQAFLELRQEQVAARSALRLAELALLESTSQFPGLEVHP